MYTELLFDAKCLANIEILYSCVKKKKHILVYYVEKKTLKNSVVSL